MQKHMTLFLFLILHWLPSCAAGPQTSALWGELQPGAYEVGFRIVTFPNDMNGAAAAPADNSPIEVMIWYPTNVASNAPRLTFSDYLHLVSELRHGSDEKELHAWLATGISGDASRVGNDTLAQILATRMQAVSDAPILKEQFPLVLWTMRHGTMVAQSVLCEYLASHGYVVAFARTTGAQLPLPWEMETAAEKLLTFSRHLRDLNFALEHLTLEPDINPASVAMVTWSYAAELAPRMQTQHPSVKLVIGLSSNPLSLSGLYQGDVAAAHLEPDSLDVPYVVMTEQFGFDGNERGVPPLLDKLPVPGYLLSFSNLAHGNFNALEGMVPALFGVIKVQPWSTSGQNAKLGYETISRYALHFLNTYLKWGGPFQEPEWQKELPPGFVRVTQHGQTAETL